MNLSFQVNAPAKWSAATVIVPLYEKEHLSEVCPDLLHAAAWLNASTGIMDFRGKKHEIFLLHAPEGWALLRVLLIGMGKAEELTAKRFESLRNAVGKAMLWCQDHALSPRVSLPIQALIHASGAPDGSEIATKAVREAVCGAVLGTYRNNAFKSGKSGEPFEPDLKEIELLDAVSNPALEKAAHQGIIHAKAVILARTLANSPANHLTPADLADVAKVLAYKENLKLEVLKLADLQKLGMRAFTSVGAGASCNSALPRHEPRLIILEYAPAGTSEEKPLIVVGKGICFDSGGLCLKPSARMWEMKSDMSGAAAVLALFGALPMVHCSRHVIGLLACAENIPGAYATRPGDIVTTYCGKTVEIVNTDAEGRLVLCDTLSYAQKRWNPEMMLDVATLTGACVVALGEDVAGLFSNEPELAEKIQALGELVGEPFWSLPLQERYFDNLKSDIADFTNSGPREGGACTAAIFLKQFVNLEGLPPTRWVHLDIAGPAFHPKARTNAPAGASGFAVRTLIDLMS